MSDPAPSKRETFLRSILDPAATAVVTNELQEGVLGQGVLLPALRHEVERLGTVDAAARLCAAAREAGARVVHCTAVNRADRAGVTLNCKIFALNEKIKDEHGHYPTELGTPGADLLAGLEDPRDIVLPRLHGMTPFTSTPLDQMLRNLGIRTVIAAGVSVNLGVLGLSLTALDLGYQVVVARDAVAGVPAAYAEAVIENTLSMIATIATTAEITAAWAADPASS